MEGKYIQSIVSIRDKKLEKNISWTNLQVEKIVAKYSNTKDPIYKLLIDDKAISRNNTLLVKYKCLTCEVLQEITLNLFMRKVNNDGVCCVACRNKDETKRTKQSQFMKDNSSSICAGEYEKHVIVKVKERTIESHLQISHSEWENEDDDFKDNYFMSHLTIDEFERIRSSIKDIGNSKITDLSGWAYEPCYKINNQTRYVPMLINKSSSQIERPVYISFICENCECKFTHRDLEIIKNKLKLFCKECSFTNKTFRIRQLKLKSGEIILWQSIYERRFIEWCEHNNITIQNGPKIPYLFQEKQRTYRVDFLLPLQKVILEMKDTHCWHIEQEKSGKFLAKENSAKEWAQKNGYTYQIVFPKGLSDFKKLCKI